ncbi:hypothetical protein H4R20_002760 [Coemansia guatemalensis]|uniref:Uncharacterized protein n=1 Tax=Coemansia guatemalensis TaxID=2761395 RepID=A0A9W8LUC3_9FUNG|nr:hypothetical protein H4R20_002760 [Coemansia guatemalensis]
MVQGRPADISGISINAEDADGGLESASAGTEMVGGPGNEVEPIPQSKSKCTVGCGVGIGVGCLAAIILIVFVFIMTRRHKRRLQTIWQHRRWLATQKELPDKPVPAPPPPTKN